MEGQEEIQIRFCGGSNGVWRAGLLVEMEFGFVLIAGWGCG